MTGSGEKERKKDRSDNKEINFGRKKEVQMPEI
jgi:hypothetical protein